MTKKEAYNQVFKGMVIHIDGLNWEGEADDKFIKELELIKQIALANYKEEILKEVQDD